MSQYSLRKYLKPHKKYFIIAILCLVFETSLEAILPFLLNSLIKNGVVTNDHITYSMDVPYILSIGGIMLGMALLAFLFGVNSAHYTAKACRGFGYELRKAEYKQVQDFSFDNLDDFRASSLITRLTSDVQVLSDTLCNCLRPALRAPLMLIYCITFALLISPLMSLIFAITLLISGIFAFFIIKNVKPKFLKIQNMLDKINQVTQESIIAIKTIKAYHKKEFEIEKFEKSNSELKQIAVSTFKINALMMPVGQIANYSTIILILYIGGLLFMSPNFAIELVDIQTFLTYVMQIMATVMMVSNVLLQINRATASYHRIGEVLSIKSDILDGKKDEVIKSGTIEFKNVFFKYKKKSQEFVLKDINFKIEDGEYIGIIGQTGSAKTTLTSLIERFYDASEGEILIDGENIKNYKLDELRKSISLSFQSPLLFEGDVLSNLLWGNDLASEKDINEATKIAECYDFINNDLKDGFKTYVSQGGTSLSGGQRQRVCIARAILKNPKILILDDSFSALDKVTEAKVNKNLREKLKNTTKVVVSQKISAIKDADRIIVMDNGKISSIGNHEYLLKNDKIYSELAELQGVRGDING